MLVFQHRHRPCPYAYANRFVRVSSAQASQGLLKRKGLVEGRYSNDRLNATANISVVAYPLEQSQIDYRQF